MDRNWSVVAGAVLAVGLTAAIGVANLTGSRPAEGDSGATAVANPIDIEEVARKLVTESAGVKEGEVVLIDGSPRDLELLESLAVNVSKVGAHPIVTLNTDRLARRLYDEVPAKYDALEPKAALALTRMIDVLISVDTNEDPALMVGVPPERLAARGAAFAPVIALSRERGVRLVNVGNGLYPTEANARILGVPKPALSEIFWAGVGADYAQLQVTGQAVRDALAAGREVRLTNPNGTDLRFRIESRPVFVSDGVISAEDVQRGGAGTQVWLPAGEVYVTPVPGTAQGKLVVDRDIFQGQEILGVSLSFADGKVTELTAESGLEDFKAMYDASGPRKDEFAYFDIGINPAVQAPAGGRLPAFMPAGMVTVGIGGNMWAGGDNEVPFGTAYFLPGSTVEVDGKMVVKDGQLAI